jgi:glycosyltransferase involved in cell wall biosynthesis
MTQYPATSFQFSVSSYQLPVHKMRIVINGWFSDQLTAGSGQYLAALTEWLPRVAIGHEFILVKPDCRGTICNANLAKLWFEQIAFPLACRRLRADVAFVPYWGGPWWSPCPVVVTVHDLIPLLLSLYRGGPLQRGYTALVGLTARRAAAILTDSEASRRDIVQRLHIPPERVHAVYLAADPRYRPVTDPIELGRTRAKYNLPDEPFLLYLGGFDARKNVIRTIQAFARMTRDQGSGIRDQRPLPPAPCPLPRLVIAGRLPEDDTPFAPDPRPVAQRLGIVDRVHFTGWVDEADKPALYSLALGVVFVSEYEGFGLPVLEAMACGCRVQSGLITPSCAPVVVQ